MEQTAKLTELQELDAAIRNAAREALPRATSRQLARELYEAFPELLRPVAETWVIEKLATLIAKYRAKLRHDANAQLVFEESLGFHRLPAKLEISDGSKVPRAEATMGAFRRHLAQLRKEQSPAIEETQQAIELMKKHGAQGRRLTWGDVLELEARKAAKKASAK